MESPESERIIITPEIYQELKHKILDCDKTDVKTVFSMIENLDYEKNLVYIMLLYKSCRESLGTHQTDWEVIKCKLNLCMEKITKDDDNFPSNMSMITIPRLYSFIKKYYPEKLKLVSEEIVDWLLKTFGIMGWVQSEDLEYVYDEDRERTSNT